MQIIFGLPEPIEYSLMSRLQLLQSGIQLSYSQKDKDPTKLRLPSITPSILHKQEAHWSPCCINLGIVRL